MLYRKKIMLDIFDSYDCMFAFNYRRVTSRTHTFSSSAVPVACPFTFYSIFKMQKNSEKLRRGSKK